MKVFPVQPRSRLELEQRVVQVRQDIGWDPVKKPSPLDVKQLIDVWMPRLYGWKTDIVEALSPGVEGYCDPRSKTIVIPEATYEGIDDGHGRCRFTPVHEFGHVDLHRHELRQRLVSMSPSADRLYRQERSQLKPYVDPEWQADYFAGALLIPRNWAIKMLRLHGSNHAAAVALAGMFGVSYSCARTRLVKMV